jgi:hypothetical protein
MTALSPERLATAWRVDHVPSGCLRHVTTWHDTKDAAMAEERGLLLAGLKAVAWEWWA